MENKPQTTMNKIGLINYEGNCLEAIKNGDFIYIKDQYGIELRAMTPILFLNFIDGEFDIVDSRGKRWNYPSQSEESKPKMYKVYEFLDSFKNPGKTLYSENEFKPTYLEALSMQAGYPVYTTNPFTGGDFKPKKSMSERWGKSMMKKEIKKGNLNYDQSGRAYPDNPEVKENWDYIWEKDGKHYKLVGDDEHKEWEEVRPSNETLYSEIEHLIIQWTIDGTKTAGSLTREIMKLIESYE